MTKPHYSHLVLAIPHAHSAPLALDWATNPRAKASADRWTDWYTDELFGVKMPCVRAVIGDVSRMDCDLERLEHEDDRICKFRQHTTCNCSPERWTTQANRCLSRWYAYRAELLERAADGTRPLVIDCHSFPSDLAPDVDVCIGFNDDATRPSDDTLELIASVFRASGYTIAFNRPYANAIAPLGYLGHSVMLEVNKTVYMDATERIKGNGFAPLQNTLRTLYVALLA